MELLMEFVLAMLVVMVLLTTLTVWRVTRIVSWKALETTVLATGSLRDCVNLILFCARQ